MKITLKQLRQIIREESRLGQLSPENKSSVSNLSERADPASIASIAGDLETFKGQRMKFIGSALETLAITVEQLRERIEELEKKGSDSL